jgi:hypothetical protein
LVTFCSRFCALFSAVAAITGATAATGAAAGACVATRGILLPKTTVGASDKEAVGVVGISLLLAVVTKRPVGTGVDGAAVIAGKAAAVGTRVEGRGVDTTTGSAVGGTVRGAALFVGLMKSNKEGVGTVVKTSVRPDVAADVGPAVAKP